MVDPIDEALQELQKKLQLTATGVRFEFEEWSNEKALALLGDRVHSLFFCRREKRAPALPRASGDGGFVAHLSATTRGASGWEPGFKVVKAGDQWAFISDGRLCLFVDEPGHLSPESARLGDAVLVRVPRARENLVPHRFTLYGGQGPAIKHEPFVKFFISLTMEGAAPLVETLSSRAADRLAFTLWVPNSPDDFERADTAVIDVSPRHEETVQSLLTEFAKTHRPLLRRAHPIFTQPLQSGLSKTHGTTSEDVADGYGKRRSRGLADAVLTGLNAGEKTADAWRARL